MIPSALSTPLNEQKWTTETFAGTRQVVVAGAGGNVAIKSTIGVNSFRGT